MKIDKHTNFPHPILKQNISREDDYLSSSFSFDIDLVNDDNKVGLKISSDINQKEIKQLIIKEKVCLALHIDCPRTFYSKIIKIKLGEDYHLFEEGQLSEKVFFRPIIYCLDDINSFSSNDLNSDYSGINLNFKKGNIIGVGHEAIHTIEFEDSIQNIISIKAKSDVENGKFEIDFNRSYIIIEVNPEQFKYVQEIKNNKVSREALIINMFFIPAVMAALYDMRDGGNEKMYWYKVFSQKLEKLSLNLKHESVYDLTQALFSQNQKNLYSNLSTIINNSEDI